MAVEAGKEELGLLAVEAGCVETTSTNVAQAPSQFFGKRTVAFGAAVLIASALASAAVFTAMRRQQAMQKAIQVGSRTQGLWVNDGPSVSYVTAPASNVHVVHHVFPETESTYHSGDNLVTVTHDSPDYSVHHVYVGSTPSYQNDGQFATDVHHDVLPAPHGDAYHGGNQVPVTYPRDSYHTVHSVYHQYPGYASGAVTYSTANTLDWQQGAGLWWVVFGVALVILCCFGLYYYCLSKPAGYRAAAASLPRPTETTRACW